MSLGLAWMEGVNGEMNPLLQLRCLRKTFSVESNECAGFRFPFKACLIIYMIVTVFLARSIFDPASDQLREGKQP